MQNMEELQLPDDLTDCTESNNNNNKRILLQSNNKHYYYTDLRCYRKQQHTLTLNEAKGGRGVDSFVHYSYPI